MIAICFVAHFYLFGITTSAPTTDTTVSLLVFFLFNVRNENFNKSCKSLKIWSECLPAEPLIIFQYLLISSLISRGSLGFSQDSLFQPCEARSSSLLGLSTCHFFLSGTPSPSFPPNAHSIRKRKAWHSQNILIHPFHSYRLSQLVYIYLLVQFPVYL